jgi:hypothetical protein
MCIYEFATAGKSCSDLSTEAFGSYPYQFQWSPDSSMIAFSENPGEMWSESDIWLFDVAEGSFTNLTDDQLVGNWNELASDGEIVVLDYLPMWNQADGLLYFWRVVPLGNMRYTIKVMRMDPADGEPELVHDLTTDFIDHVPLFDYERLFLDGMSAIAPDGSTLAVITTRFNDMGMAEQSVWTLDLTDDDSKPVMVADVDDFLAVRPEWAQDFAPQAMGLTWTADSAGFVFLSLSALNASLPFETFHYVDAATGALTPIVDFSSVEDEEAYFNPAPSSELPWRVYSPWTATLSPEGDKLLMVNDLGGVTALLVAPLPPTGELPAVSETAQESPSSSIATASRSADGKIMLYSLLLTITEE